MTTPYILTRRSLNPSAVLLARDLDIRRYFEPRDYPPVIRWGNSEGHWDNHSDSSKNLAEIIYTVSDKLRFSRAMELIKIPCVEIRQGMPERFPVVIRHSLSGSKGQGIEIYAPDEPGWDDRKRNWQDMYWSYWRNFHNEYGVHFFNGKILKIFKKIPREGIVEEKFPIKNMDRGYRFSLVSGENLPKLHELVEGFCDTFGMTFGRLDVGWNPEIKKYEIIEANSAPGIAQNENTLKAYVQAFKEYLNL